MLEDAEEIVAIVNELLNITSNWASDDLSTLGLAMTVPFCLSALALVGVGYITKLNTDVLKNVSFWGKNSRGSASMKDIVEAYRGLLDLAKQQMQEIEEMKLIMTKIKESGDLLINLQNQRLEHFKVLRGSENPVSLSQRDNSKDEMLDQLVQMIQGYSELPSEVEEIKKLSVNDIDKMKQERVGHHETVLNLFNRWVESKGACIERLILENKQKLIN